jgi:hypothetical protein
MELFVSSHEHMHLTALLPYLIDKHIFDEIDRLTYPSADLELRDTPHVSDGLQVEDPSSTLRTHAGKEDDLDEVSVRSLMSEPTSTAAQRSCATVENWFNKICPINPPLSMLPSESTPALGPKRASQDVDVMQTDSTPFAQVSLGREVASQTDPAALAEPSSPPAALSMAPTVVPMVHIHPMPECM